MGHSMGGGTPTNVSIAYPELPRAIILEDPAWMPLRPESQNEEEAKKQREGIRDYLTGLSKKTLEELIAECRKDNPRWSEAEIKPWAQSKLQFDANLFSMMAINPGSYEALVPKIKCPALLVIAENGIVTREVAENAARLWKSKQPFKWVQIKGAAHNIRRENFKDYMEAVFDFLKSLRA